MKLRIEAKAIQKETLWLCEYDLPTERTELDAKLNKEIRSLRNAIVYVLKYKVFAQQNLESSWFIDAKRLDETEKLLLEAIEPFMTEFPKEFDMENRIKILPIFTTKEGHEVYRNRKVGFIIEFIDEMTELMKGAVENEHIGETGFWRAKKCIEMFDVLRQDLEPEKQFGTIEKGIKSLKNLILKYEQIKEDREEE